MSTATALKSRAARIVASKSTAALVSMFEATETAPRTGDDMAAVPMVRGWIMDALQERNPAAFDAWMGDETPASPRRYFVGA